MKKILIIVLVLLNNTLYAQQVKVIRDFGVWFGLIYEKKISKDFDLNLEQQIRTFKNSSLLDDSFSDLGLQYSINKHFDLATNVRYIYDAKRVKEPENNFRYNFDIEYKKTIRPRLNFRYRLRYQKEYVDLFSGFFAPAPQKIYSLSVRNKVRLIFKYNRTNRFFFSSEIFRLSELFREPYFNKARFFIGDKINSKIGRFDLAIGFEQEIGTEYPSSFFLIKTIYRIKK